MRSFRVPIELLCKKLGMTRLFDEAGTSTPVTVLQAGPNVVVQKKLQEKDGYNALQLGYEDVVPRRASKPRLGHFEKAGVAPKRHLSESRLAEAEAEKYEVGQELAADLFEPGQHVDVIGVTKGRGTTGVVKRHNFDMRKHAHGAHEYFRHGGSIGPGSFPGRVIKGLRMPGRYGAERVTTRNLEVMRVDREHNLLFVRGAVPGYSGGVVRVRSAVADHA